jgi:hypothetical protein
MYCGCSRDTVATVVPVPSDAKNDTKVDTKLETIPLAILREDSSNKVLSTDPLIIMVSNFLSPAELLEWSKKAESSLWVQSAVQADKMGGDPHSDASVRSSTSASVYQDWLTVFHERISKMCGFSDFQIEASLVSYQPGQFFKLHYDGWWRRYTFVVYLTDGDKSTGGETEFPHLKLSVVPQKGAALFFRNTLPGTNDGDIRTQHQANTSTVPKRVLNLWVVPSSSSL